MSNLFGRLGRSVADSWKKSHENAKKQYLISHGKMCPKCEQIDINKVGAKSWLTSAIRGKYWHELYNRSKDLYVCKNCGFSWESR